MDNFVFLTYYEARALLTYLKDHLLEDMQEDEYDTGDANYLLSALLKLQCKYDDR